MGGGHRMAAVNPIDLVHELRTVLHGSSGATDETPKEAWEQCLRDVRALVDDAAAEPDPAVAETNRQTDTSRLSDFDGGDLPFDGAAADRRLGDMRRGLPTSSDVAGLWADEPVRACGPYCGGNDDKEQTDD